MTSVHAFRVPLAPPNTLVLAANTFSNFRFQEHQPSCTQLIELTGSRLKLREGGAIAQTAFREGTLERALEDLMLDKVWVEWTEALKTWEVDATAVETVLAEHQLWQIHVERRKEERAAWELEREAARQTQDVASESV